jgi:hypothetical protein
MLTIEDRIGHHVLNTQSSYKHMSVWHPFLEHTYQYTNSLLGI